MGTLWRQVPQRCDEEQRRNAPSRGEVGRGPCWSHELGTRNLHIR